MSKIKKGPEGKMQDYLEVLTGDRPKDSPELKAQKGGQIPKPGRGNLDPRSPMGKILNSSAARATRRGVQLDTVPMRAAAYCNDNTNS